MTPEQQILKMTTAIRQTINVMGERFGSTATDVAREARHTCARTPRTASSNRERSITRVRSAIYFPYFSM